MEVSHRMRLLTTEVLENATSAATSSSEAWGFAFQDDSTGLFGTEAIVNVTSEDDTSAAFVGEEESTYEPSKVVLLLPRITAVISLLAIVCVAMEAWKDISVARAQKSMTSQVSSGNRIRSSTTTSKNSLAISRIQLFYQIPLFCQALALALGTAMVPQGEVWSAIGNITSCNIQGFLLQFGGIGIMGWDMALSTSYLMMVLSSSSSSSILSYEKYYHVVIWPALLVVSFYPLPNDMYNPNHGVCWLETYPSECLGDDDCLRGDPDDVLIWQTLSSLAGIIHLLYSIAVMISIYCSIRGLENTTLAFARPIPDDEDGSQESTASNNNNNRRRYSRAIGIQGMLYAGGMIITTVPTVMYIVLWNLTGFWNEGFGTFALTMTPLMGYVNFCIFLRGRTIEDCHSRYAKLLRRAHSWIFDYQFVCQCRCSCVPKRYCYGGSAAAGGTLPTTRHHGRGSAAARSPPHRSDDSRDSQGFWTDAVIQQATQRPWMVSELGESQQSDSMWISEKEVDDCAACDPQHHRRCSNNEDVLEKPPVRPQRVESCAPPAQTTPVEHASFLQTTSSKLEGPPTKPERYESEVPAPFGTGDNDDDDPDTNDAAMPLDSVAEISSVSNGPRPALEQEINPRKSSSGVESFTPPKKPARYESELETGITCWNTSTSSSSEPDCVWRTNRHASSSLTTPPSRPIRLETDVEPLD